MTRKSLRRLKNRTLGEVITSLVLIETIALIAICLTLGRVIAQLLAGSALELPTFVCVLFVGVISATVWRWWAFIVSLNVRYRCWVT